MQEHNLDIQDKYFQDVKSGIKTFEIRQRNRDYNVGDKIILKNLDNNEVLIKKIKYICDASIYNQPNIIILGI
jgi:ASC-1-like (ASCH) protein